LKKGAAGIAAASICALAAGAAGQPVTPAPQRETVQVIRVEVPVAVTDDDGRPITGLTAADFEVRDDGRPVRLEAADPIGYPPAPPPGAPPDAETEAMVSTLAGVRKFVLLFDLTYATQAELQRTIEGATHFVREQMGPLDAASVATISASSGVKVLQPFSADRGRLLEALDVNQGIDNTERQRLANENPSLRIPQDARTSLQQDSDRYRRGLASQLLGQLEALAANLERIPGRKNVVLFSHGFDPQLLTGVVALPSGPRDLKTDPFGDTDAHGDSGLRNDLERLHKTCRKHDTVIYGLDLAGISSVVTETSNQRVPTFARGRESLAAIADGTGGLLLTGSNDYAPLLDRVMDATRSIYLLSFAPPVTGSVGKFHPLKIKVLRRGARVFARTGYYERATLPPPAP
jgi:VWFA-related protein